MSFKHTVYNLLKPAQKTENKKKAGLRWKPTILLTVFFLSTIVSLPILNAANAGAESKYNSRDIGYDFVDAIDWQIRSNIYYTALLDCAEHSQLSDFNVINEVDINNGKWFTIQENNAGRRTRIGTYVRSDLVNNADGLNPDDWFEDTIKPSNTNISQEWDGRIWCKNAAFVKAALNTWQIPAINILCNAGMIRDKIKAEGQTPETCINESGTVLKTANGSSKLNLTALTTYLKTMIYSPDGPNQLPGYHKYGEEVGAPWYLYYRHTLNESCIKGIDKSSGTTVWDDDSKNYTNLSWVNDETGEIISNANYGGTLNNTTRMNLTPISATDPTCKEIASEMNKYAQSYKLMLTTQKDHKRIIDPPVMVAITSGNGTTCSIAGVGWVLCPIIRFLSGVVDSTYAVVSNLLEVSPLNQSTNDPNNGLYIAWSAMRSFANVAFVIVFLIIIFSQLTSVGVTNYGIKKLLPKIIIAAILVNLSYYICTIAVDLSNIIGVSIKNVIEGAASTIRVDPKTNILSGGWSGAGTSILGGMESIAGIVIVGKIFGPALFVPVVVVAALAIITVFLVLTIRQALIVLLIAISPLAFVAFLLPNTAGLFKKWAKLLSTMLLMYPIISLMFAGSDMASRIIIASGQSHDNASFAIQLMGGLVQVVPLALSPLVMMAAGSVLGKMGGQIQNFGKKHAGDPINKLGKDQHDLEKAQRNNAALNKPKFNSKGKRIISPRRAWLRNRAKFDNEKSFNEAEVARSKSGYVAEEIQNNEDYKKSLAKGGGVGAGYRAEALAISLNLELKAKEIKAANAVIENLNLDSTEKKILGTGGIVKKKDAQGIERIIDGANEAMREAGIISTIATGKVSDVEEVVLSSDTMTDRQRRVTQSNLATSKVPAKASYLGDADILDKIGQGTLNVDDDGNTVSMEEGLNIQTSKHMRDKLSSESIPDQDIDALKRYNKSAVHLTSDEQLGVNNKFQTSMDDKRIASRINEKQKEEINKMLKNNTSNTPPPPPPINPAPRPGPMGSGSTRPMA